MVILSQQRKGKRGGKGDGEMENIEGEYKR
jgi:hypothetical protein